MQSFLTGSSRSLRRRQGKISFSGAAEVHEFDAASPAMRRMELRRSGKKLAAVRFDVCKLEMEAHGIDPSHKLSRQLLLDRWNEDLRDELKKKYGLELYGTSSVLSEMQDLAKIIRRRADLRIARGDDLRMPTEMSRKELKEELRKRKIEVKDGTWLSKVTALEEALLKEWDGVVGDGYDFGKRFVKVEDIVRGDEFSDAELRKEIKKRGLKAPRKKVEKIALLEKIISEEKDTEVMRLFREELEAEARRREVGLSKVDNSDHVVPIYKSSSDDVLLDEEALVSPHGLKGTNASQEPTPKRRKLSRNDDSDSEIKLETVFQVVFESQKWKDNVHENEESEEEDDTENESNSNESRCILS